MFLRPDTTRSALIEPDAWRAAQAASAADLARAALAVGQLDMLVGIMGAGAVTRLALIETQELSWAAGTPVPADELATNVFLRTQLPQVRHWAELQALRECENEIHVFAILREKKNNL